MIFIDEPLKQTDIEEILRFAWNDRPKPVIYSIVDEYGIVLFFGIAKV